MYALIDAAFTRTRTIALTFIIILVAGASAYIGIPKEAEPDVTIPFIYVSMSYEGISPEDAERLLVRPMEKELQSIEGLKEMKAVASEGYAAVTLEFSAGFDADQALRDVRERVDIAKSELPPGTNEPRVQEVNVALFPVLTVALSGAVPERTLIGVARDLREKIEALPGVLEVDIGGDREEVMEILIDPATLQTYGLTFDEVLTRLQRNNQLVAAGTLESSSGQLAVKVPGVIENAEDVIDLPVKVVGDRVVTFGDVATVRRTFKDPSGFARIDGKPAVALEIKKRVGANIIETIAQTRAIIDAERVNWGEGIQVTYLQDKSEQITEMLTDLQNNVLTAIVLVMIVIVAALGPRPALLVGLAIPGSFLAGMLVIHAMGYTLNIVVLFSLILVVGMLVDGAIVTVELADRRLSHGVPPREAYASAAKRMTWPIMASTATTLAVFVPLVFWPGVVGEFMKYLPITVLITLSASLAMALVFIPVLGGAINRGQASGAAVSQHDVDDDEDIDRADLYYRFLSRLLDHPGKTLMVAIMLLVGAYMAYGAFGKGVEFFPEVEPDFAQVQVRARGDLSVWEKDRIVREVEQRLYGLEGVETLYARTLGSTQGGEQNMPPDTIGIVQMDFTHWRSRPKAREILQEVRARTADVPGVLVQVREQDQGPSGGKPIQLEVAASRVEDLAPAVNALRRAMTDIGGFTDVEDSRPLPGVEWQVRVDREKASRFGADVALLGQSVQLVTNGIHLGEYRPDDADEELDIRVRYPYQHRSLERLDQLRIPTSFGSVPITNFVGFEPAPKTGTINRTDTRRVLSIKADVADGLLPDQQVQKLREALPALDLSDRVQVSFKGEDADQREAMQFLMQAFIAAIFLMLAILVTQFNRFYQAMIILSAIVFSTAGVLLGLLVTGRPFGIVMGGIGVIALAGIVVNNNIVLIDTYNQHRKKGMPAKDAILRTALQRRRPVLLTSVTTILGLLPMVFAMNINLIEPDIAFGAPSTQWWTELSSAIAGGLAFATVLTLVLTPCLLMLGQKMSGEKAPLDGTEATDALEL